MEKIDEIREYIEHKLKYNVKYIYSDNYYQDNIVLSKILQDVASVFNTYVHYTIKNNILIVDLIQYSTTKYKETLNINLNKYLRKQKLLKIL